MPRFFQSILRPTCAVLVLLALAARIQAGDADALRVEAIGLRVAKSSPATDSMFWRAGTAMMLQISSDKNEFVRMDSSASSITKITDDAGNDMLAKIKGAVDVRQVVGISRSFEIDAERKLCAVEALTPMAPAKGSKSITVTGVVVMDCAVSKKETVVENVKLRSGTKIAGPGNLTLSLEQIGKPNYGTGALEFVLRSERELDDVAEVKFFKAGGAEIKSARTGTSSMTIEGASKVEWTYTLNEFVDAATVKLYTWTDMKKKTCEFTLKVDLGL